MRQSRKDRVQGASNTNNNSNNNTNISGAGAGINYGTSMMVASGTTAPQSGSSAADTGRKRTENAQNQKHMRLVDYRNGSYQGTILSSGDRTCLGLYAWDSGEVYFGEWKHDMLDGEGILFFPMGGFIHGFFQRNRLNGAAFFKFENGDIYEGFWRNGKLEGNCYKYFTDHDRWILSDYKAGEFKKILAKGDGLPPSYVFKYITSANEMAARHENDTEETDGMKIEAIAFNDGGQFLGLIEDDMPTSLGLFRYNDGKYDVGLYQEGNLHGLGRFNLHNGDVYDGLLSMGLFEGKEKFRLEHHRQGLIFVDKDTPLDIYSLPRYNQRPVSPELHNFYLDLSIASLNSQKIKQIPKQPQFFNQLLPKELTEQSGQQTELFSSPRPNSDRNTNTKQDSTGNNQQSSSRQEIIPDQRESQQQNSSGKNSKKQIGKIASIPSAGSTTKTASTGRVTQSSSNKLQGSNIPVNSPPPHSRNAITAKSGTAVAGTEQKQPQQINKPKDQKLSKSKDWVSSSQALTESAKAKIRLAQSALVGKKAETEVAKIVNNKTDSNQRRARAVSPKLSQQQQQEQKKRSKAHSPPIDEAGGLLHQFSGYSSGKQRSPPLSVSKIQQDRQIQDSDTQSIHEYDNMVAMIGSQDGRHSNASNNNNNNNQGLNLDEVLAGMDATPKSKESTDRDWQMIGRQEVSSGQGKDSSNAKAKSQEIQRGTNNNSKALKSDFVGQSKRVLSQQARSKSNKETSQNKISNKSSGIAGKGQVLKPNLFGAKKESSSSKVQQQLVKKEQLKREEQDEQSKQEDNERDDSQGDDQESQDENRSSDSFEFDQQQQQQQPKGVEDNDSPVESPKRISIIDRQQYDEDYESVQQNRKKSGQDQNIKEKTASNERQKNVEKISNESKIKSTTKGQQPPQEFKGPIKQSGKQQQTLPSQVGKVSQQNHKPQTSLSTQLEQKNQETNQSKPRQSSQPNTKETTQDIKKNKISQSLQQQQSQSQDANSNCQTTQEPKSTSTAELLTSKDPDIENLRNEIASYEQLAQTELPERKRGKSRGIKDTSRSRDTSSNSRTPNNNNSMKDHSSSNILIQIGSNTNLTPNTTQANISSNTNNNNKGLNNQQGLTASSNNNTPDGIINTQWMSQQPNFQQSPISQRPEESHQDDNQEDDLQLEESEHVLDSIKQIKQQMLSQLHDLEDKQNSIPTPTVANFKFNVVPSFSVPAEENNQQVLGEEALEEDVSPQNPVEQDIDDSFKLHFGNEEDMVKESNHLGDSKSQGNNKLNYYTEDQAKIIAQKIEQNLTAVDQANRMGKEVIKGGMDEQEENIMEIQQQGRQDGNEREEQLKKEVIRVRLDEDNERQTDLTNDEKDSDINQKEVVSQFQNQREQEEERKDQIQDTNSVIKLQEQAKEKFESAGNQHLKEQSQIQEKKQETQNNLQKNQEEAVEKQQVSQVGQSSDVVGEIANNKPVRVNETSPQGILQSQQNDTQNVINTVPQGQIQQTEVLQNEQVKSLGQLNTAERIIDNQEKSKKDQDHVVTVENQEQKQSLIQDSQLILDEKQQSAGNQQKEVQQIVNQKDSKVIQDDAKSKQTIDTINSGQQNESNEDRQTIRQSKDIATAVLNKSPVQTPRSEGQSHQNDRNNTKQPEQELQLTAIIPQETRQDAQSIPEKIVQVIGQSITGSISQQVQIDQQLNQQSKEVDQSSKQKESTLQQPAATPVVSQQNSLETNANIPSVAKPFETVEQLRINQIPQATVTSNQQQTTLQGQSQSQQNLNQLEDIHQQQQQQLIVKQASQDTTYQIQQTSQQVHQNQPISQKPQDNLRNSQVIYPRSDEAIASKDNKQTIPSGADISKQNEQQQLRQQQSFEQQQQHQQQQSQSRSRSPSPQITGLPASPLKLPQLNQSPQQQQHIQSLVVLSQSGKPISPVVSPPNRSNKSSRETSPLNKASLVQVFQEVLPPVQQTTIQQKQLPGGAIQQTLVTKTTQPIVTTRVTTPIMPMWISPNNSQEISLHQNNSLIVYQSNSPVIVQSPQQQRVNNTNSNNIVTDLEVNQQYSSDISGLQHQQLQILSEPQNKAILQQDQVQILQLQEHRNEKNQIIPAYNSSISLLNNNNSNRNNTISVEQQQALQSQQQQQKNVFVSQEPKQNDNSISQSEQQASKKVVSTQEEVFEEWKRAKPEAFKDTTPREFYAGILQRQQGILDLSPEQLAQLESDILLVKELNRATADQQVFKQQNQPLEVQEEQQKNEQEQVQIKKSELVNEKQIKQEIIRQQIPGNNQVISPNENVKEQQFKADDSQMIKMEDLKKKQQENEENEQIKRSQAQKEDLNKEVEQRKLQITKLYAEEQQQLEKIKEEEKRLTELLGIQARIEKEIKETQEKMSKEEETRQMRINELQKREAELLRRVQSYEEKLKQLTMQIEAVERQKLEGENAIYAEERRLQGLKQEIAQKQKDIEEIEVMNRSVQEEHKEEEKEILRGLENQLHEEQMKSLELIEQLKRQKELQDQYLKERREEREDLEKKQIQMNNERAAIEIEKFNIHSQIEKAGKQENQINIEKQQQLQLPVIEQKATVELSSIGEYNKYIPQPQVIPSYQVSNILLQPAGSKLSTQESKQLEKQSPNYYLPLNITSEDNNYQKQSNHPGSPSFASLPYNPLGFEWQLQQPKQQLENNLWQKITPTFSQLPQLTEHSDVPIMQIRQQDKDNKNTEQSQSNEFRYLQQPSLIQPVQQEVQIKEQPKDQTNNNIQSYNILNNNNSSSQQQQQQQQNYSIPSVSTIPFPSATLPFSASSLNAIKVGQVSQNNTTNVNLDCSFSPIQPVTLKSYPTAAVQVEYLLENIPNKTDESIISQTEEKQQIVNQNNNNSPVQQKLDFLNYSKQILSYEREVTPKQSNNFVNVDSIQKDLINPKISASVGWNSNNIPATQNQQLQANQIEIPQYQGILSSIPGYAPRSSSVQPTSIKQQDQIPKASASSKLEWMTEIPQKNTYTTSPSLLYPPVTAEDKKEPRVSSLPPLKAEYTIPSYQGLETLPKNQQQSVPFSDSSNPIILKETTQIPASKPIESTVRSSSASPNYLPKPQEVIKITPESQESVKSRVFSFGGDIIPPYQQSSQPQLNTQYDKIQPAGIPDYLSAYSNSIPETQKISSKLDVASSGLNSISRPVEVQVNSSKTSVVYQDKQLPEQQSQKLNSLPQFSENPIDFNAYIASTLATKPNVLSSKIEEKPTKTTTTGITAPNSTWKMDYYTQQSSQPKETASGVTKNEFTSPINLNQYSSSNYLKQNNEPLKQEPQQQQEQKTFSLEPSVIQSSKSSQVIKNPPVNDISSYPPVGVNSTNSDLEKILSQARNAVTKWSGLNNVASNNEGASSQRSSSIAAVAPIINSNLSDKEKRNDSLPSRLVSGLSSENVYNSKVFKPQGLEGTSYIPYVPYTQESQLPKEVAQTVTKQSSANIENLEQTKRSQSKISLIPTVHTSILTASNEKNKPYEINQDITNTQFTSVLPVTSNKQEKDQKIYEVLSKNNQFNIQTVPQSQEPSKISTYQAGQFEFASQGKSDLPQKQTISFDFSNSGAAQSAKNSLVNVSTTQRNENYVAQPLTNTYASVPSVLQEQKELSQQHINLLEELKQEQIKREEERKLLVIQQEKEVQQKREEKEREVQREKEAMRIRKDQQEKEEQEKRKKQEQLEQEEMQRKILEKIQKEEAEKAVRAEKQRQIENQRKIEAEAEAQRRREQEKLREIEFQKQLEIQREIEAKRQLEIQREVEKQRQLDIQRDLETKRQLEVQREVEAKRQFEVLRELEAQRQREQAKKDEEEKREKEKLLKQQQEQRELEFNREIEYQRQLQAQRERDAAERALQAQRERDAAELILKAQREREAAERLLQEKRDREAAELALNIQREREAAERALYQQKEREAAERALQAQREREATELAIKVQRERDAAARALQQQKEREAAEIALKVQKEREAAEIVLQIQREHEAAERILQIQRERQIQQEIEANRQQETQRALEIANYLKAQKEIEAFREREAQQALELQKKQEESRQSLLKQQLPQKTPTFDSTTKQENSIFISFGNEIPQTFNFNQGKNEEQLTQNHSTIYEKAPSNSQIRLNYYDTQNNNTQFSQINRPQSIEGSLRQIPNSSQSARQSGQYSNRDIKINEELGIALYQPITVQDNLESPRNDKTNNNNQRLHTVSSDDRASSHWNDTISEALNPLTQIPSTQKRTPIPLVEQAKQTIPSEPDSDLSYNRPSATYDRDVATILKFEDTQGLHLNSSADNLKTSTHNSQKLSQYANQLPTSQKNDLLKLSSNNQPKSQKYLQETRESAFHMPIQARERSNESQTSCKTPQYYISPSKGPQFSQSFDQPQQQQFKQPQQQQQQQQQPNRYSNASSPHNSFSLNNSFSNNNYQQGSDTQNFNQDQQYLNNSFSSPGLFTQAGTQQIPRPQITSPDTSYIANSYGNEHNHSQKAYQSQQRSASANASFQNSALRLPHVHSPNDSFSLTQNTCVTVVHTQQPGAVSLVKSITNTVSYSEPVSEESLENQSNLNKSLLESQASSYLQQTINSRLNSPIRQKIVVSKATNSSAGSTHAKYYQRPQPILEDLQNEEDLTPIHNSSILREQQKQKKILSGKPPQHPSFKNNSISNPIDEQDEGMCHIF